MNRRDMLKVAGAAIAGATLLGTEAFAKAVIKHITIALDIDQEIEYIQP